MSIKEKNNSGMATVEATLILPVFIFGMLMIYHMIQCRLTENIIYDAAVETAEYISLLGYLNEDGTYIPELYFSGYLDDEDKVKRYVTGGVSGINFWGSRYDMEDDCFILNINYTLKVGVPFMPAVDKSKNITITKRFYVGNTEENTDKTSGDDVYVYITDNMEVYHSTRLCSHLNLTIKIADMEDAVKQGYEPCEFCGYNAEKKVLVTDNGDKYHAFAGCSGLKRTIHRVKLSETGGVPACTRCVN